MFHIRAERHGEDRTFFSVRSGVHSVVLIRVFVVLEDQPSRRLGEITSAVLQRNLSLPFEVLHLYAVVLVENLALVYNVEPAATDGGKFIFAGKLTTIAHVAKLLGQLLVDTRNFLLEPNRNAHVPSQVSGPIGIFFMNDDSLSRSDVAFAFLLESRGFFIVLLDEHVQVAMARATFTRFALAQAAEIVVHVLKVQVPRQYVAIFISRFRFSLCERFVVSVPIWVNISKIALEAYEMRSPARVCGLEIEFLLIQVCRLIRIHHESSADVVFLLQLFVLLEHLLFFLGFKLFRSN